MTTVCDMNGCVSVEGFIPAIGKVTVFRESNSKKATFRAIVLDWDKDMPDWSMKTSNGVRYHRKSTLEAFNTALTNNGSLPIMYNHITDGAEAEQLGIIEKIIDTEEGLIIEGVLNMSKPRVVDEIIPGYLKNVSLQVIAHDFKEDKETDTVFAKPSRALEVSFVPVNGREGAKLLDVAIMESLHGKSISATDSDMEMARKAVAFEEILSVVNESDLSMAFKFIEGKLGEIDLKIKQLKKKGKSDKDIVKTISKDYGIPEKDIEDLLGEDITTSNSSAVIATKMRDKSKEDILDDIKDKKYELYAKLEAYVSSLSDSDLSELMNE